MAEPAAATARGRATRERILTAAADLVADRGFHAVGVNDIGAAAGVTGAALYRHFATKTAVLVALFDRAVAQLDDGAREIRAAGGPSRAVLRRLVAAHVAFALRDRATLVVYSREVHNLPAADQRHLRRAQRRYVESWRAVLGEVEPALDPAVALTRVEAVFGLLNSAPVLARALEDTAVAAELRSMAEAALLAPSYGEAGSRSDVSNSES